MKTIAELIPSTMATHSHRQGPIFPVLDDTEATDAPVKRQGKKVSSEEFLRKRTEDALQRQARVDDVLQEVFPLWTEDRRGVPNPFIRGGLFTTRRSTARESIKSQRIASLSNYAINYSGEELRQDDLSLWICLLTRSRGAKIGQPIYFSAYGMIKDLGWRMHSDNYEKLRQSIERMKLTSVNVLTNNSKGGYAGSLIRDYAFDAIDDNGDVKWMVRLEPAITELFNFDSTTLLEWSQRKKIGARSTIALWLHTFYSSHSEPIPFSVAKIHELSRSEEKKMANFRIRLRQSLDKLVEIGFLLNYSITNDLVYVQKANNPVASGGPELSKAIPQIC